MPMASMAMAAHMIASSNPRAQAAMAAMAEWVPEARLVPVEWARAEWVAVKWAARVVRVALSRLLKAIADAAPLVMAIQVKPRPS